MSKAHLIAFAGANMLAEILDGKAIAKQIQTETKLKVADFVAAVVVRSQNSPAVLVGEDPASQVFECTR